MSPIARGNWGRPQTSPGHFPNVFDYWSPPRSTLSHYRLSANCQPKVEPCATAQSAIRFPVDASPDKRTKKRERNWRGAGGGAERSLSRTRAAVSGAKQLMNQALRHTPKHRRVVFVQYDAVTSLLLRVDVVAVIAQHCSNVLRGLRDPP